MIEKVINYLLVDYGTQMLTEKKSVNITVYIVQWQRRHETYKHYFQASRFAEWPPGPATYLRASRYISEPPPFWLNAPNFGLQ